MTADPQAQPPALRRIAILGSTGSIGTQTLAAINHLNQLHAQDLHPTRYEVVALCAHNNSQTLAMQAEDHASAKLGICDPGADTSQIHNAGLIHASDAPTQLIEHSNPDLVIAAIVGIAGLPSTLRAAELGIDIALANKESLVAGGSLVTKAAQQSGCTLLPIDSEHNGLWQCLQSLTDQSPPFKSPIPDIQRVTLTASGGPFRDCTLSEIEHATPEQALNHPTWDMGAKVSIDSATLINKALKLIEAHWLFNLSADQLEAVIHPQSTIHALVQTHDHSVLAHLGPTDMRCPIQHALTHPLRAPSQSTPLDLPTLGSLDFLPIDPERFPAINLAKRVITEAQSTGVVLNAANEAAVDAFLDHRINFGSITNIISRTLDEYEHHDIDSLESIMESHNRAMSLARNTIDSFSAPSQ